jgi:hypothetical protein
MPAVTTEAEVCNLALGLIGHRQYIDDLGEQSAEAEACSVFFASVRDELLAKRDWHFASVTAQLALSTETRRGWGVCYVQPADCLEPREVDLENRNPARGEPPPFAKQLNDARSGWLICTDVEEAVLRYTARLTTVALWPPHFVKAVATELAMRLIGALPVKRTLMPAAQVAAEKAYLEAAAADENSGQRDEEPDAEWIRVR